MRMPSWFHLLTQLISHLTLIHLCEFSHLNGDNIRVFMVIFHKTLQKLFSPVVIGCLTWIALHCYNWYQMAKLILNNKRKASHSDCWGYGTLERACQCGSRSNKYPWSQSVSIVSRLTSAQRAARSVISWLLPHHYRLLHTPMWPPQTWQNCDFTTCFIYWRHQLTPQTAPPALGRGATS